MADPIPGLVSPPPPQDPYANQSAVRRELARQGINLDQMVAPGSPSPSVGSSTMETLAAADSSLVSPEMERYLAIQPRGPLAQASGEPIGLARRPDLPDHPTVLERLGRLGKGFVDQFNPFGDLGDMEGAAAVRERVFRTANVASLFIPAGWLIHATRLGKAVPAFAALATTARGRVALQAMDAAVVNGSLELIRSPEERGEHGITFAVGAGLIGGAVGGKISEALMRRRNANISQAILAAVNDEKTWAIGGLDAVGDWAVIPHRSLTAPHPRGLDVLNARRLFLNFEEAGIANEVVQGQRLLPDGSPGGLEEMTLMAGLKPHQVVAIGKELGLDYIQTNHGLVDVARNALYPADWAKARIGAATSPLDGFIKLNGGDHKTFSLPNQMNKPMRLASTWGFTKRDRDLVEVTENLTSMPGAFGRVWERFRNVDIRQGARVWYSELVNAFGGGRTLDKIAYGKSSEHLPFSQSMYKSFSLAKSHGQSFVDGAVTRKLLSWDGTRSWTHVLGEGNDAVEVSNFIDIIGWLDSPEAVQQFRTYGFLQRMNELANRRLKAQERIAEIRGLAKAGEMSKKEASDLLSVPQLQKDANLALPPEIEDRLDDVARMVAEMGEKDKRIPQAFEAWTSARQFFYNSVMKEGGLYRGMDTMFLSDPTFIPLTRHGDAIDRIHNTLMPEGKNWVETARISHKTKELATITDLTDKYVPWIEEDIRRLHTMARVRDQHDALQKLGDLLDERPEFWENTLSIGKVGGKWKDTPLFERVLDGDKTLPWRPPTNVDGVLRYEPFQKDASGSIVFKHTKPVMEPGKPTPTYVTTTWRTSSREMVNLIQSLGSHEVNTVVKLASTPAALVRAGVVLSTDFMGRNLFRDTMFTFVNAGLSPLAIAKGMASRVKKDAYFDSWVNQGGLRSTMSSVDFDPMRQMIAEASQKPGFSVPNVVKHPVQALAAIGDALESFTRLGLYRREVDKALKARGISPGGLAPEDIAMHVGTARLRDATFMSRDGVTDFSVVGANALMRNLRYLSAFLSPSIASMDTMVRHIANDPKGVMLRGSLITSVGLGFWALNRFGENKEEYAKLPDWEKMLFWHVKRPKGMLGDDAADPSDDRWVRIPKPFEYGLIFSTMPEAFLWSLEAEDPGVADELMLEILTQGFSGVTPSVPDINVAKPFLEILNNEVFMTGAPIVPDALQGLDPEVYTSAQASVFSRGLARILNHGADPAEAGQINPIVLDHIFKSWTGTFGREALDITSNLTQAAINISRQKQGQMITFGPSPELIDNLPFIGGMVTNPQTSQAVADYYELADWMQRSGDTGAWLEENLRFDDMIDYKMQTIGLGHPQMQLLLERIQPQMLQLREAKDAIMRAPGLDGRAKQQQVYIINQQMDKLAELTLEVGRNAVGFNFNKGPKNVLRTLFESGTGLKIGYD